MESSIDDEILQIFFQDSAELIANTENDLVELVNGNFDQKYLDKLQRLAHGVKGGAGAIGLESLAQFAQTLEKVVKLMRKGTLPIDVSSCTLLLRAVDLLRTYLQGLRKDTGFKPKTTEVEAEMVALLSAHPN